MNHQPSLLWSGAALVLAILLNGCITVSEQINLERISRALQLVDQGTLHLRQGMFHQAEASFEVALELGAVAPALDGLGSVAFLRGRYDQAESYFLRALQADQAYVNVLGNLALLSEVQGSRDVAESYYRRALLVDPANFRVRNNFAVFHAEHASSGADIEESRRELEKALSLVKHPLIAQNLELSEQMEVEVK